MEDEFLKRNTDCVYFLASPLTCKKGIECEYRHSDIARLNPRDCWYWLSGSCLNPTCVFRHPPLDAHDEVSSETATVPPQEFPTSMSKADVPCYFYFNGFCNKGEHCTFSHGLNDISPARKPSMVASAVPVAPPIGTKASAGNETKATPIKKNPNQSETHPKSAVKAEIKQNDIIQKPVPMKIAKQSASPEISLSDCEAAVGSESSPLAEGSFQIRSLICTDQSSDEQVDDHIEPEERWESSPGFDVLVDGRSDVMGYEDDPEYCLSLDRDGGDLNGDFLGYDFMDQAEYDPLRSDAEIVYKHESYKPYDCIDEHISDYGQIVRGHSMKRILDPMLSQKRKLLPVELTGKGRNGLDLRDRLSERRGFDGYPLTFFSRRHGSSHLIARTQEKPQRHNKGRQGRRRSTSFGEKEYISSGINRQERFRRARMNCRYRQRFEEKWQPKKQYFASEVQRKPANTVGRSTKGSSSFTGPKTLAEIKEGKKGGRENGVNFGIGLHSHRTKQADFQGPKPLSEILKEKQRFNSDDDIGSN